jgi:hypothetical protein
MEVICSSVKSVDFQRTTRRYIPEDSSLQVRPVVCVKSLAYFLVSPSFLQLKWITLKKKPGESLKEIKTAYDNSLLFNTLNENKVEIHYLFKYLI